MYQGRQGHRHILSDEKCLQPSKTAQFILAWSYVRLRIHTDVAVAYAIRSSRSIRIESQPALSRHDELRAGDDEADSFAIMDRALELGLNFFDTANVYGWKVGEGWTEQIVGRWFAQGGGRREKVVLATKVFGRMGEWPNQSRLSALHIKRACEDSLRRLQTDCIDLYQMHHVDRETPWEEIWQAMEQLVREGKVLYVGSSNFAGWHLAQAQELARSRHFLGLVSEQSLYNLTSGRSNWK